jgi:hypothetical protein
MVPLQLKPVLHPSMQCMRNFRLLNLFPLDKEYTRYVQRLNMYFQDKVYRDHRPVKTFQPDKVCNLYPPEPDQPGNLMRPNVETLDHELVQSLVGRCTYRDR